MKRMVRLAVLLPVLGAVALALAVIGRLSQGDSLGDALFHALQVLTLGGDYPDSGKWPGNRWIEVARWVGLLFFVLTARKAFGLLLSTQWNDLAAQFGRRDLVLVGDHPLLAGLASRLVKRRRVLWLNTGGEQTVAGVRVVGRAWGSSLVKRYRLGMADAVVVALAGRQLEGLQIGRDITSSGGNAEVVLLSDLSVPDVAPRLRPGSDHLRALSPDRLAARAAHDGYAPFEAARRLGHRRIHALFLGGGAAVQEIIADLLLSSPVTFLDRPRITVVDPDADSLRLAFELQMPDAGRIADLGFVTSRSPDPPWLVPLAEARRLAGTDPFTVVYVCGQACQSALRAALAFDDLAAREGWEIGWIFFREHDGRAADFGEVEAGRLRPMGTSDQIADSLGLMGGEQRRIARQLHETYRDNARADAPANVPWDALPHHLREANHAGLAHLPAKLESAGVSLAEWCAARRRLDGDARLPPLPDLDRDQALLRRLAALEHERWMAERVLAGWRLGPVRDDRRRIHPDLVPFAELPAQTQSYDVNVVLTLAAALKRQPVNLPPASLP